MGASKEERKQAEILGKYGIMLGTVKAEQNEPRLFLCAVRGLLIFMAVFGTLGGLVSAFGLEYSLAGVGAALFFISMFIAFIYYNKVTFYVGYILLLTGFALYSARYFAYINSGYQAFLNTAAKVYGSFFSLPALREASEMIDNRYLTVSAVMIFLGAMLALLLNISISAYMSLIMTFLITFLPLQIAFYVNRTVPLPYLMMLIAVYISVMVLKRSGNFALPSKYGKEHIFEIKRKSTGSLRARLTGLFSSDKEKKTVYKYLVSGPGMITIAGYSAAIAASFLLVMNGILVRSANNDEITNSVKAVTDEYVKTIAQGGISALFNRYDSTGGLSHGQLGGVGSVNPDFETDLIVRFVPYSADSLYLRSYVGKSYGDNRFWPTFTAGERPGSIPKVFDSSGRQKYEEGWGDDDYLPVLAGNEGDEPVKLGGGLTRTNSNDDTGNGNSAEYEGLTDNSTDSEIRIDNSDSYQLLLPDEEYASMVYFLRAYNTFLDAVLDDPQNAGKTSEMSSKELTNMLIDFSVTAYIDDKTAQQLGWDRLAKLGLVNSGADRSMEYVPYYTFSIGRNGNETEEVFSNRWKNFASKSFLIRNYVHDNKYISIFNSQPDGIDELKSENNAFNGYPATFLPYTASGYYQPNPTLTSEYERYVYEHYLEVPEEMLEMLGNVAREAGIDTIAGQAAEIKDKYTEEPFSFYDAIMDEDNGMNYLRREDMFKAYRWYLEIVADLYDNAGKLVEYGLIDAELAPGPDGTMTKEQLKKMNLYALELLRWQCEKNAVSSIYSVSSSLSYESAPSLIGSEFDRFAEMVRKQVEIKPITGYECAADETEYEDYLTLQKLRLQLLRTLKAFYRKEFSYTMSPGRTPSGKDVIDYFLTSRRRGYCAHFAASACLLLRSVGIPARYVEGYVVQSDDVSQGRLYSTDTAGWKYGSYGFTDSAVVDVEVSDASAHAWIEVYIDGHGWIPYEMTPPSEGDELGEGVFGFLRGIITGRQSPQSRYVDNETAEGGEGGTGEDISEKNTESVANGINFLLIPAAWMIAVFAAALIAVFAIKRLLYVLRLRKLEKNGEYSEALLKRYRAMLKRLKRKGIVRIENPSVREVFSQIRRSFGYIGLEYDSEDISAGINEEQKSIDNPKMNKDIRPGDNIDKMIEKMSRVINAAAFSGNATDSGTYAEAVEYIGKLLKYKPPAEY